MQGAIFIGDELTAAGFRLAGCDVATPEGAGIGQAFDEACRTYALVMVSASHARRVNRDMLEDAIGAWQPLVVIIPDILGHDEPEDMAAKIRAVLGVEP